MINVLDNIDDNNSQTQEFRISKADPLYPFSIYGDIAGNITRSTNEMFVLASLANGYHSLVQEDTLKILENLKPSVLGDEFELNRYYYLRGNAFLQGSPSTLNDGDLYACNPNFYYNIYVQGKWNGLPLYNDKTLNMRIAPNNQIVLNLESSYDRVSWNLEKTITFTCGATLFDFASEFMIKPTYHKYYRVIFSHVYTGEIKPITRYGDFYFYIVFVRKPRLSWKYRVNFPGTVYQGSPTFNYQIPVAGTMKVPFAGIYAVHAFFSTNEIDFAFNPANCASPQMLQGSGDNSGWVMMDASPTFNAIGVAEVGVMVNSSLQGSVYLYTADFIYLTVTLPNGTLKKITGGYADLHFMGDMLSPAIPV